MLIASVSTCVLYYYLLDAGVFQPCF